MSENLNVDPYPEVKADPGKPWKAIAGAAVALLGLLWANLSGVENWGSLDLQDWVTIVVPAILTFGATYFVRNPLVTQGGLARGGPTRTRDTRGVTNVFSALGAGLIVLVVLLLVLTLLNLFSISWVVLVVLFVIGLVLVFLGGRDSGPVL